MDTTDFGERAVQLIEYFCAYFDNVEDKLTLSDVKPGFLKALLPAEAPTEPEKWEDVFPDISQIVMQGVRQLCVLLLFLKKFNKALY